MDSKRYIQLLKKFDGLDADTEGENTRSSVSYAILSNSETNQLQKCLGARLFEQGFQPKLIKTEFNNFATDSLDTEGELFQSDLDFVFFVLSPMGLKETIPSELNERSQFASSFLSELEMFVKNFSNKGVKVFLANIPETSERVFGNMSRIYPASFLYQIQAINAGINNLVAKSQGLYLVDLASKANYYGLSEWHDNGLWLQGKYPCHPRFFPTICDEVSAIFSSLVGKIQKCLVLDLDNTLWGGVAGDDGIDGVKIGDGIVGEAHVQFQKYVLDLKNRGVVLTIASKNYEDVAIDIIENHPRMILRKNDFAVIKANWEDKASNIQEIAAELNIGLDSLVFLDDNPFERGIVRDHLPQVCVPELPEDPTEFVDFLTQLNLFETTQFSDEDLSRSEFYYSESERKSLQKNAVDLKNYLSMLNMEACVKPIDEKSLPRSVQLSQRSNQFNLRTQRIDEMTCEKYIKEPDKFCFTVDLTDKYGALGIISCVFMSLKKDHLYIDEFIMSCRVLKRTVESLIFNEILNIAKENKAKFVVGEYIRTKKNKLVENLYQDYGFENTERSDEGSLWRIEVSGFSDLDTSIKVKRS